MNCEIDVWLVDLSDEAVLAHDMALLSDSEQTRFRRFISLRAGREFASTRIALRRILGSRLGLAPEQVALSTRAGKPFIEGAPRCCFNVTHASGLAAIAVHEAIEVGVDLEHRGSFDNVALLSQSVCSSLERAWCKTDDASTTYAERFARLWTGKEAALKATSHGFAIPPDQIDLSTSATAGGGRIELPSALAPEHGVALLWQTLALPAGWHGAVAALAPLHCDQVVPRYRRCLPAW